MLTKKNIASDAAPAAIQVSRNGLFNDEQIVQAAAAAHDAMRALRPKYVADRVTLIVIDIEDNERATEITRTFLGNLLKNKPATGRAIKAESLTDEQIAKAVKAAHATGMIALTFTDKTGVEKPTVVIDDFLRNLLPQAQQA